MSAAGLLVCDVDSTFLQDEVIELVAEHAGVRAEVEAVTAAAMRGELDFAQSLRARVALLRGLDAAVLADVRAALRPTPGALELVARAREHGWATALVSGGFHEAIDDLARAVGVDHVIANRFATAGEDAPGTVPVATAPSGPSPLHEAVAAPAPTPRVVLTGEVAGPIVDAAAKREALVRLAARHRVPRSRTIAIGDGANDLLMLEAAGIGIAFRAKPVLRTAADVVLDGPSLLEAWPHLAALAR